jgi:hypothetical protein
VSARKTNAAATPEPKRDPRIPAVGTVLERTVKGRAVRVTVLEVGFRWNRKTYRSLSAIATKAYGCPANGFLTFGLVVRPPTTKAAKTRRASAKEAS